jgi:hypothetical protein
MEALEADNDKILYFEYVIVSNFENFYSNSMFYNFKDFISSASFRFYKGAFIVG